MPDAGCRMPDAQCSLLPNVLKHGFSIRCFSNRSFSIRCFCGQEHLELETLSEEGLDNEIAMLTIYLISRLSSFVYRLSPNYSFLFVSRLFFTQKYPSVNSLPRRRHQVSPGSKPLPSRVRAPLVLEHQGRGSSTTIFSLPGDWAEFLSEMRVNGSTAGNRCLRNTISFAKSMPTLTIST